jgi:hypothetical protein
MKVYITNDYHIINLEDVSRIAPNFVNSYCIRVFFRSGDSISVGHYKTRKEVYDIIEEIYEKMNRISPL